MRSSVTYENVQRIIYGEITGTKDEPIIKLKGKLLEDDFKLEEKVFIVSQSD